MKARLIAKQVSRLSISPQLQNAIKLLQMSAIEINNEIQKIFENNPLIEKEDSCEDFEYDECENHYSHYQSNLLTGVGKQSISTSEIIESVSADETDIKRHLMWQIHLLNITDKDKKLAESIIDYINDDGYLIKNIETIFDDVYLNSETSIDELIAIQHLIQNLDPIGTCCIGIQESLIVQLQNIYPKTEIIRKCEIILKEFFDEFVANEFNLIKKNIKLNDTEILEIKELIKSQNARPGSKIFSMREINYIIPDVTILKKDSKWEIKANHQVSPNISINEKYVQMIESNIKKEDSEFLKENLREAKSFIKNIKYRNDTLLNISQCIFNKQLKFFKEGSSKIVPLNLNEVAKEIGVHESTVSRLTTGKYIETPYGVFELKFFFSTYIKNDSGENVSSSSIKEKIKILIKSENKAKPLSDEKIVNLLKKENINIARRTVSKYRIQLNYESSSKRKTK